MNNKEELLQQLEEINSLEITIEKRVKGKLTLASGNDRNTIDTIIGELSMKVINSMFDKRPVFVSVMDGAMTFSSKLLQRLRDFNAYNNDNFFYYEHTTMRVSSYKGTISGELNIVSLPKLELAGRNVVILDEVADTGKTYAGIRKFLLNQGVEEENISLVVLVDKVQERSYNPTFSGVKLGKDDFLVGEGMDLITGAFRELEGLYIVDPSTLPTEEEKLSLDKKPEICEKIRQICKAEHEVQSKTNATRSTLRLFASNGEIAQPNDVRGCCIVM